MKTLIMSALVIVAFHCEAVNMSAHSYTMMPPYPTDPKDYINKWDPYVLRSLPGAKEAFLSVTNRYNQSYPREISAPRDSFPLVNGRQIARDASGNWFVIVERGTSLVLATGRGPKIAGGDLAPMELAGSGPGAVFASQGEVVGASLVIDGNNRLHVAWYGPSGLWYTMADNTDGALEQLREKKSWTEPRQLVKERCHPGDIMLDADGKVVVCYSHGDTVYYLPVAGEKAEPAAGSGAGMSALAGISVTKEAGREFDDAKPTATNAPGDNKAKPAKKASYPPPLPLAARECQDAVMDLAPDGTVYLAFRRDFQIWVARRAPAGGWQAAERAACGPAFHPSIIVTGGRPLVCFQFEGIKNFKLGCDDYFNQREGGGSSIGFATPTKDGWRAGCLAKSEEIFVNRQGIWDAAYKGKLIPMVEQMGRPVLFRDRHGVAWSLWQNTTRRWAYCARWMGEEFGQVQECRGPFNAPGLGVSAEKFIPATATDLGVLFVTANRVIFDRLKIPTLSLGEERQVMFLDSLEVGETSGLDFVLNKMTKHPDPVLSPGAPGSRDDRGIMAYGVNKHGATFVMRYQYQTWDEEAWKSDGLAISTDGLHWQKVETLPKDLPPADPDRRRAADNPLRRGYLDNPDQSDPSKKYIRTRKSGEVGWAKGSYEVQYSPDGKQWTNSIETSVLNAMREGAHPNLWDPLDPERPIKIYGRVYTQNFRSCGLMWSKDLLHWGGGENFLDVDDPYGTPPAHTPVDRPLKEAFTLRGQVFLDACAGKNEDQIYSADITFIEGLYFCEYWPCTPDHRMDVAIAVSRDGLNFTRIKNGERTLPVGPAGTWDSGYVFQYNPVRDGDILRVYYRGTAIHHGTDDTFDAPMSVGLATIRVNGWTYYTPKSGASQGTLTTIPIQSPAGVSKGLTVNIEGAAGQAGAFTAEVLDAVTQKPIEGFGAADCVPPTGDGSAVPVTWKGGAKLPAGKDIRLRFHLGAKGVRLYSFGFQ